MVSAYTTSELVGLDCVPPHEVPASVSVVTRSGTSSASSCATMPPIEKPKTCAWSTPTASSTARASAASNAVVRSPAIGPLRPMPRWS